MQYCLAVRRRPRCAPRVGGNREPGFEAPLLAARTGIAPVPFRRRRARSRRRRNASRKAAVRVEEQARADARSRTVMSIEVAEAPPKPYSASAAAVGVVRDDDRGKIERAALSVSCRGSSCKTQPRLGALSTVNPRESTSAGGADPDLPSNAVPAVGAQSSTTPGRDRRPPNRGSGGYTDETAGISIPRCRIVPFRSMRAPRKTVVSLRSRHDEMRWPSRCRSTRVAGLPGRRGVDADSRARERAIR